MKKFFFILLSTLLMMNPVAALANSAQTYFQGISPTGTLVAGEQSPLVVEQERLTFDLQEFPVEYYSDLEEYLAYTGRVTAEYTFHNPADYDVTVKLAFPFGQTPDYGYSYNHETEQQVYAADGEKYDVSVDGVPIEKTVRHTLFYRGEDFALEKDLPRLVDGYAEDGFWKFDTPVTKYTYTIDGIGEEFDAARLGFQWNGDENITRLMLAEQCGGEDTEEYIAVTRWVENGDTIELYAFGEPLEQELEWFSENGAEETPFDYTLTLESTETMTFEEFAMAEYPEDSGILSSDWYNAMVTHLHNCEWNFGVLVDFEYIERDFSDALLRWYEYEITVPAGGSIVNTVTAPMYPSADLKYQSPIYQYTYLLSPAQTWAEFGRLDIVINTSYYLTDSGLEGFEKTDSGYALSLDGLPQGELEFTLSAEEKPKPPLQDRLQRVRLLEAVILFVIAAISVRKYNERQQKNREQ